MKRLLALLGVTALLLSGCGKKTDIQDTHTRSEAAYTLSDGAEVSAWTGDFDTVYCLPDGTELLREREGTSPGNVSVVGLKGFEDLSPAAQESVAAYYGAQGLCYDLQEVLEDAYAEYLDIGARKFQTHHVEQSVSPSGETAELAAFTTVVQRPLDRKFQQRMIEEESRQAVFHRQTGELIPVEALFAVPMEDVAERLVELTADDEEPPDPGELRRGFSPDRVLWAPDGLTILYPAKSLTGVDTVMEFYFDQADFAPLLYTFAGGQVPGSLN